jgi:hypothetical protein
MLCSRVAVPKPKEAEDILPDIACELNIDREPTLLASLFVAPGLRGSAP